MGWQIFSTGRCPCKLPLIWGIAHLSWGLWCWHRLASLGKSCWNSFCCEAEDANDWLELLFGADHGEIPTPRNIYADPGACPWVVLPWGGECPVGCPGFPCWWFGQACQAWHQNLIRRLDYGLLQSTHMSWMSHTELIGQVKTSNLSSQCMKATITM